MEALVEADCLKPLVELLEVNDSKVVNVALEAIENILKTGKTRQEEEGLAENPYVAWLERVSTALSDHYSTHSQADGFEKLERLQYVSERSSIHKTAVKIISQYLEVEGDEPVADFNLQFGARQ